MISEDQIDWEKVRRVFVGRFRRGLVCQETKHEAKDEWRSVIATHEDWLIDICSPAVQLAKIYEKQDHEIVIFAWVLEESFWIRVPIERIKKDPTPAEILEEEQTISLENASIEVRRGGRVIVTTEDGIVFSFGYSNLSKRWVVDQEEQE